MLHGSAVVTGERLTAKEYIFAWLNERLPDLGVVSRIDVEEGEFAVDFDGQEVIYGFGTRRAGPGLCDDHPREPRFGIPGRADPADDAALPDAAAEPGLPGGDARQTPGRAGRAAQGVGDRGQGRPRAAAMVEARAVIAIA